MTIVGPTASGKTRLSIELAKYFKTEIISADSMQIYKNMDIGTAKPTVDEMQGIKHHLIDFLDPNINFSVSDYVEIAKPLILKLNKKGKLPIIVGGTGLYIDSLVSDIKFADQKSDESVRKNLQEQYNKYGIGPLLEELSSFDKEAANRIHPNNILRIIRAIELYRTTGITMTEQIKNSKLKQSPYNNISICLLYRDRSLLYDRINRRVDLMIESGLIDEAKRILSSDCSMTAMNAICYKELVPYLNGESSLKDAVENLKRGTRKYAKRQITWFKRNSDTNFLYVDDFENFT